MLVQYPRNNIARFKIACSERMCIMEINTNWTLKEFINIITPLLQSEFNIDYKIILVDSNKDGNNEKSQCIQKYDIPMNEWWNNDEINNLSFYVVKSCIALL